MGSTVMLCRARTRGPVGPRHRAIATTTTRIVNTEKATRASVRRGDASVLRGMPNSDIRGRYGL
ncbi:MAG: hypothetical protein P4L20_01485 [Acidimicrobiales bacterium]|nr:hypothetical protein [Acidimicrobiales bacterium]